MGKFSDLVKPAFLSCYEENLSISFCCTKLDISKTTIWRARKADIKFDVAIRNVKIQFVEGMAATAIVQFDRLLRHGKIKFTERFLQFLLKSHDPATYGDRITVAGDDGTIDRIRAAIAGGEAADAIEAGQPFVEDDSGAIEEAGANDAGG